MANNENAYSTSCEIIGPVGGSLSELARHDFAQVRELFSLDIARLDETENGIWSEMKHYENALENSKAFNHRIRDRIVEDDGNRWSYRRPDRTGNYTLCVTICYIE